jgi:curved DNA-binding protein CbpA
MDSDRDPYRVLQVDPQAHESVIRAAYRALARLYHPDGVDPDGDRMAELNGAYDLLRDPARRRAYDAGRALAERDAGRGSSSTNLHPVGPGRTATAGWPAGPGDPPSNGAAPGAAPSPATRAARPAAAPPGGAFARARQSAASPRLDFGRYQGWTLADVARTDPDYLRWLRRHSSGLRFRAEINRLLPAEPDSEPVGVRGRRF